MDRAGTYAAAASCAARARPRPAPPAPAAGAPRTSAPEHARPGSPSGNPAGSLRTARPWTAAPRAPPHAGRTDPSTPRSTVGPKLTKPAPRAPRAEPPPTHRWGQDSPAEPGVGRLVTSL